MGREVGGGFRMQGTCVILMPIHVNVWQKKSQYCKVIILQLKQINFKRRFVHRITDNTAMQSPEIWVITGNLKISAV